MDARKFGGIYRKSLPKLTHTVRAQQKLNKLEIFRLAIFIVCLFALNFIFRHSRLIRNRTAEKVKYLAIVSGELRVQISAWIINDNGERDNRHTHTYR